MRTVDYDRVIIFFLTNTNVALSDAKMVIQWSDDGATIPFVDGGSNELQTDIDIVNQLDGTFKPQSYGPTLTVITGNLVAGVMTTIIFTVKGGSFRIGVRGTSFNGNYSIRAMRVVGK